MSNNGSFKAMLPDYKHILNEDVYNKYLFFLDKPKEGVTSYCLVSKKYLTTYQAPEEDNGSSHSFIYGSDQVPYYARYDQPCWGPLAGLPNNQSNLYIWTLWRGSKTFSSFFQPANPFYIFFKEVRNGMFKPGVEDDTQAKFLATFGAMFTPSVLDVWSSPVVVGFHCAMRYGGKMITSATDFLIESLLGKSASLPYSLKNGTGLGGSTTSATWAQVRNFIHGEFNPSIMKLPPMSKDPDYQSWDSPLKNLFCDHDVTALGRYYTYRATDIHWDEWVIRNAEVTDWYGRNNGSSQSKAAGEVVKAVKATLLKAEPKTYDEARQLISDLIREKVNNYGTANLAMAA